MAHATFSRVRRRGEHPSLPLEHFVGCGRGHRPDDCMVYTPAHRLSSYSSSLQAHCQPAMRTLCRVYGRQVRQPLGVPAGCCVARRPPAIENVAPRSVFHSEIQFDPADARFRLRAGTGTGKQATTPVSRGQAPSAYARSLEEGRNLFWCNVR